MTQEMVGRSVGVSRVAVAKWESPHGDSISIQHGHMVALAKALCTNERWLETGEGPAQRISIREDYDIRDAVLSRGKVPLITWGMAGTWESEAGTDTDTEIEEWYDCPIAFGAGTFVLRVKGPAMWKSDGTGYPDGSLIFCDPTKMPPRHNQDVIMSLQDSGKTIFRRYLDDGCNQYLTPLNPDWPDKMIELTQDARCKAVVIGSFIER